MRGKKKEVKVVENHVIVKGCHEKMMKLKDKGNTYRNEGNISAKRDKKINK